MQRLWQDLRYGARMLLRRPGFTLVAVLALALGIGVNTAIFSGVNALLLHPSAYEKPEELVNAFVGSQRAARVWDDFSYPDYLDYRDQNRVFSGLIAHRMTSVALSNSANRGNEGERAEVVWGETVSGNYFDVLGVRPAQGRGFTPEEDRTPNTHPVVVLSHALWQRRFGANESTVGQSVYLNGRAFTVIGVAPESFQGTKFPLGMDFWVPLMMRSQLVGNDSWRADRDNDFLYLTGRLKPGVTREQAEADLNAVTGRIGQLYPDTSAGLKVQVVTEREGRVSDAFPTLRLISALALGIVTLVLLVACANVANLMLARAAARRKEIGVRLALGAGRWRIVRQLLTESLLLASCGGLFGLLVTFWATDLMNAATPVFPYRLDLSFSPDWRVMRWAAGISLLTGVVFGLAPALNVSRTDLVPVLKGDGGEASGGGLRRWGPRNLLVVAQLAISIVVLVCAGLLLESLRQLRAADPGFKTGNLISMQLDPELLGYDEAGGKRLYAELAQRTASLPGVASATVSQVVPLSDNNYSTGPLILEGQEPPRPNQGLFVSYSSIGTRYFETMGTQLLAGRDFSELDRAGAPHVVIINQTLARRLFGSEQNALGKRFYLASKERPPLEIAGIAKDGKYRNLFEDPRNYMFVPHQQRYYFSQASLLVRATSSSDLKAVAEGLRQEVQKLDARLPVFDLKLGDELLSYAVWGPRMGAWMASAFGLLALTLAGLGLYSVMAYAVSRRTREIGIRMALGAERRDVLRLVIGQGAGLIAVGVMAGTAAAFALSRVMSSLLFGVSANDPLVFAGVAALLAGVALLACYVPARRAAKVDPMVALRCEY